MSGCGHEDEYEDDVVCKIDENTHWCRSCGAIRLSGIDGGWAWRQPFAAGTLDNVREQLRDVAAVLVTAGILTEADIARDGVRFAVRNKLLPQQPTDTAPRSE